jgi:UDP-4-amino-4,6-dideoxy-N-acetyl-beta-L-altrosamine transaminase
MIPYGRQDISEADIQAVLDVLNSDFLTQGPQVPLFEKTVANYCNAEYGVAVNSATSALHIACLALGLESGDWLWTSTNSFVASANCGLYCGANIDFVDIDSKTYNLSVVELENKLIKAKLENKIPKIVVPVHFAGQSCDMKKIYSLSIEYGFHIIEDASHAIGGKYLDKPIGNCKYSDIVVFSFHPVKIVTTAEGGLATTNSEKLAEKMRLLRNHGISRDQKLITEKLEGIWYYQQIDLGFNYRMTELQAALGTSQMKRLDNFIAKRHILQERYDILLSSYPLITPFQSLESYSAMHLYPIQLKMSNVKEGRMQIFNELRKAGVGVNVHYIPIHTQPYYRKLGFKREEFPNAIRYYEQAISIPMYSSMSIKDQDFVVERIKECVSENY